MNMKKYLYLLAGSLLLVGTVVAAGYSNDISYTYDQLNRLTGVTYGDGTTIQYSYDELGNRITQSVSGGSDIKANFTASPTSGPTPLTVTFNDNSTGTISSWSWNFGDGGSSTSQNPTHTYSNAGIYTAILTISNGAQSSSAVDNHNGEFQWANSQFQCISNQWRRPAPVQFTDSSTGNVTGWSWTFGDGGTSTSQNPSHTYINPGTYTVTLAVSGPTGTSAPDSTSITVVPPPPVANFSATPTGGTAPLTVQFTDTSSGAITG